MLKTIVAKRIVHVSPFGEHDFLNVPVVVDTEIDEAMFNPATDDYSLSAEVITVIEREMAKRWVREYLTVDVDKNHQRRGMLLPNEIRGIMSVLGVNAAEFMELLGYQSRGTLTKILQGEKPMGPTAVNGTILLLLEEIRCRGFARTMLEGRMTTAFTRATAPVDDVGELLRA